MAKALNRRFSDVTFNADVIFLLNSALGPDQRATPMQALHAVTLGAAYQYFEEDTKGSITAGKQADLVILGANPLTVDPDTIKDIPVIETFAKGRSIYRIDQRLSGS